MRIFLFLALVLSLSSPALASSVLLPSEGKKDVSNPYLPRQSTPSPAPAASVPQQVAPIVNQTGAYEPEDSDDEASVSSAVPQSSPLSLTTGGGSLPEKKITPLEAAAAKAIASGKSLPVPDNRYEAIKKKIDEFHAAEAKLKERDPLILTEPEFPKIERADMTNVLTVGVATKYVWGMQDVRSIEDSLGYNGTQILDNCQLRVDATLSTSIYQNLFQGIVLAGTKTDIRYAGNLEKLRLVPRAMCKKPNFPLPRKGRIITRTGDLMTVHLGSMPTCAISPATDTAKPSSVLIQYDGDKGLRCDFR